MALPLELLAFLILISSGHEVKAEDSNPAADSKSAFHSESLVHLMSNIFSQELPVATPQQEVTSKSEDPIPALDKLPDHILVNINQFCVPLICAFIFGDFKNISLLAGGGGAPATTPCISAL